MCRIRSAGQDEWGYPVWECTYHHGFIYNSMGQPEKCERGLEVPTQGWRLALLEKRRIILDKTGGKCAYCGIDLDPDTFHADHAQSSFNGGSDDTDNLLPACFLCNPRKNHRDVDEFREWVKGHMIQRAQELTKRLEAFGAYLDDGIGAKAIAHLQEVEKLLSNATVTFYIDKFM